MQMLRDRRQNLRRHINEMSNCYLCKLVVAKAFGRSKHGCGHLPALGGGRVHAHNCRLEYRLVPLHPTRAGLGSGGTPCAEEVRPVNDSSLVRTTLAIAAHFGRQLNQKPF